MSLAKKIANNLPASAGNPRPDRPGDGNNPGWWAVEPDVCRISYGVPHRVDRLKALGNAVVPQNVMEIGLRIRRFLAASEAE